LKHRSGVGVAKIGLPAPLDSKYGIFVGSEWSAFFVNLLESKSSVGNWFSRLTIS